MKKLIDSVQSNGSRISRLVATRNIKDFLLIAIGVAMVTIELKEFLLPNGFLDGGAVGMALLINQK